MNSTILPKPNVDLARLRSYRMGRLRDQMRRAEIPLVILTNPVSLRYAVDYRDYTLFQSHIPTFTLFVPLEGPVVLHGGYRGGLDTIDEVRPSHFLNVFDSGFETEANARRFAAEVADFLRQIGADSRRVALEPLNPSVPQALLAAGLEVSDAESLTEQARCIKSPEELTCQRHAIQVAELAMARMAEALTPGITENQLWALLHQTNIAHDGDWIDGRMLCAGARTNPWFNEASDKVIEAGDLVAFDSDMIGPFGYCADISRTFFCDPGRPTAAQRDVYRRAYDEVHHNIDLIKPGLSFRELSEQAYLPDEEFIPNRYPCLAHGVGMSDEYPKIAYRQDWDRAGYDGVIEVNMVLSVESYSGAVGGSVGVKLEQMVLVTEQGCEPLSHYPFEERLLG